MKRYEWDTLKDIGVYHLTGEACGISLRILCDLTEPGAELVESFLGTSIKRGNNWNYGGRFNEPEHVASVMFSPDTIQGLLIYAAARDNDVCMVLYPHPDFSNGTDVYGMTQAEYEERRGVADRIGRKWRVYMRSDAPGNGLRNQHAFSGRVE